MYAATRTLRLRLAFGAKAPLLKNYEAELWIFLKFFKILEQCKKILEKTRIEVGTP